MLDVVEHHQQLEPAQVVGEQLRPGRRTFSQAQGPPDRREQLRRIGDRREIDDHGAVGELGVEPAGELDRKPGLADPTGPDQRDQPRTRVEELAGDLLQLPVSADRSSRRDRQAPGPPFLTRPGLERRVLLQDAALEPAQCRARLQPEVVHHRRSPLAIGGQRVGLPPCPVQRQHELGAQALP